MKIIGLCGKARVGKDSAADVICRELGFSRYAFAKPFKDMLAVAFGLNADQLSGSLKEEVIPDIGKSPRELQQTLGSEWGRYLVHEDVWLILAKRYVERCKDLGVRGLVITDVRFENEANFVRELGGNIWHIEREIKGTESNHASELGVHIQDEDEVIINSGSFEEYQVCIAGLVNYHFEDAA